MLTQSASKRVWLVIADRFSLRVFIDCGIVRELGERLRDRLELVVMSTPEQTAGWQERLGGRRIVRRDELFPRDVGPVEKVSRRLDLWLDRRIGFFPLAIRLNIRHGFHLERMAPGHRNWFLDSARVGPLPRWKAIEPAMLRWQFGRRRYVSRTLLRRMGEECSGVVLADVQDPSSVPFLLAGRRLRLPVVGYVASWDHTVGKGIVSPHLERYVVQNAIMRDDLARYHGIGAERVVVTGWPQTDVFHRRRPRSNYEALLREYGLDPLRPVVLVMGNSPTNAPYEGRFVARLVGWWEDRGGPERFQLILRPHPRDDRWEERFAAALGRPGVHVQEPSYTDLDVLATLLQHGDCVVSNAGTILLDSLVNDRPAVCVLYDEGAPPGESWAAKNVLGEHYRQLMESGAFYRAHDFEDVVQGIERALAQPEELAEERRRVAREVAGEVDGRAAERVVHAIMAGVGEHE